MNKLIYIFSSILLLFCYFAFASDHVVEDLYRDIRSEYRTLIIEDSGLRDVDRWMRVENKLKHFIDTYGDDRIYLPRAMYLLGRLYEQKSQIGINTVAEDAAIIVFNRIVEDFSGDDLADDSLLAIARIRDKQKKYFEAKESLNKIISDYGSSDSMSHAQKLYSEIEAKEYTSKKAAEPSPESNVLTNQPSLIGSLEERSPLVLIDPGHGGSEDGAIGPAGIKEKDITLAISFLVRDMLRETGKVRVQLTRVEDETIKLADRTSKANEIKADLFVSIHANASEYKASRGVETYYLDNTDDKSSLRLAERENFVAQGSGSSSLSFIVSDFIQGIKMDDSISLAHFVQDSLIQNLKIENPQVKNLGVKRAPFYVLVGAHMPCILTEVSFIDHHEEGRLLSSPKYQRLIAKGVFEGIVIFLKKKLRY